MNPALPMIDHVIGIKYTDLSEEVIKSTKIFLLDTIGCSIAGSSGPSASETLQTAKKWGDKKSCRVWGSNQRLPHTSAAIVNAYQIHCLEFDCVHESGVLHPMSTLIGAALTEVDKQKYEGKNISGKDFIAAIVAGIDVSCSIAKSSNAPMRFFRPALTGGFGATAAVAKLRHFNNTKLHNALGIYYGQAGGNMQAHIEGSVLLGLQVGFGARNALVACDFAEMGIEGPKDFLTGKYGYFNLMEGEGMYNLQPAWSEWGVKNRILEVGHKPFPSGRLTHYAIDALIKMKKKFKFNHNDIQKVICKVPPLTLRLVGRPYKKEAKPNYAKLCLSYISALTLIYENVSQQDFQTEKLSNNTIADLAKKVIVEQNENENLNAFGPQLITVYLNNGEKFDFNAKYALGDPKNPLSHKQQIDKFLYCWEMAKNNMSNDSAEKVIKEINNLENLDDASTIIDMIAI